jgi:hypothetical protein
MSKRKKGSKTISKDRGTGKERKEKGPGKTTKVTPKGSKGRPKGTTRQEATEARQEEEVDEGEEEVEYGDEEYPEGDQWLSPVCFDARSLSQFLREALDEAGFTYRRTQSDKLYHQTMVLFPLPKTAYVFRFQVKRPIEIFIDFYDTKPSHAGIIPYMEMHGLSSKKLELLRPVLDRMIKKLVRPPWQFTISQRLQHGLLIPEWGRAKKAWRQLGFRV